MHHGLGVPGDDLFVVEVELFGELLPPGGDGGLDVRPPLNPLST